MQSLLLYTFWQQRVPMIFMPLYSWYSVSNIQTEYFLSAAVRFGCKWCKLRNCDVIQICRGWNFQFEFWINWLRWNFLRPGNFEPFLAIGFPSMAIFRPTNAKRNILVKKKSLGTFCLKIRKYLECLCLHEFREMILWAWWGVGIGKLQPSTKMPFWRRPVGGCF